MSSISTRKKDHIDLTLSETSQYRRPTGFEKYQLKHNALPECGLDDISFKSHLLGRDFDFPLFISSMTGGHGEATNLNADIATFCEQFNIPFGVGSQRAMLKDSTHEKSFTIVRDKAPNAFIAANIGGAQLIGGMTTYGLKTIISSIQANAIIVHLNPLQELIQPEGDVKFSGVLKGIEQLAKQLNFSKNLKNFLLLLIEKRRIFFVKKVFDSFLKLSARKRGEINASLISSKELSHAELDQINKDLSETTRSALKFDYKVDKSLIGGLKLQLGSFMIDTSIKNKLKKYEQIMLED